MPKEREDAPILPPKITDTVAFYKKKRMCLVRIYILTLSILLLLHLHLCVFFLNLRSSTYFHSTNTMPTWASILGSMNGWLITSTTHVSMLWSSISRLIRFSSELPEIPSSRRNIDGGVYDQPHRPSVQDLTASLHPIYCFLMGSLIALIAIKYQGSKTNPFREHPILMMLLLITIFVYGVTLTITLRRSNHEHSVNKLMVAVSHICGILACELLLLVLVSPIQSLLINVSVPTLIVMLALCNKYALHLLHAQQTEEQASQMADLEAPPAA